MTAYCGKMCGFEGDSIEKSGPDRKDLYMDCQIREVMVKMLISVDNDHVHQYANRDKKRELA